MIDKNKQPKNFRRNQSINLFHQMSNCWMVTAKDHKGHQSLLHQWHSVTNKGKFKLKHRYLIVLQATRKAKKNKKRWQSEYLAK